MKDISISQINLSQKEHFYTGESCEIYRDNSYIYKIFDDATHPFIIDKIARQKALEKYDRCLDSHFILPKKFILDKDGIHTGYIKKNYRRTTTLYDYGENVIADIRLLNYVMLQLSSLLRKLHYYNIVLGDFHFNNVLINRKNKLYLIDFDNIKIDELESFTISRVLSIFLKTFNIKYEDVVISKDTDNLSCLLSLLNLYFGDEFLSFDNENVFYVIKRIPILQEIIGILEEIIKYKSISNVPYVDELLPKRKRP